MHVLFQRKKNELKSWGCNTRGIGRPGSNYHKQHKQQGKIKQKETSQIAKKYIGIQSVIMCVQYSSSVLWEIFIDKNSKSFNCCKVLGGYVDTFFCIYWMLQNQGKKLFTFVLEGLSVQIFFTGSLFLY